MEHHSRHDGGWRRSADYPAPVYGASAVAISDDEILACGGDHLDMELAWSKS